MIHEQYTNVHKNIQNVQETKGFSLIRQTFFAFSTLYVPWPFF
jgi:hypothetical protein